MQRDPGRREGEREAAEEQDDDEDQPDVICFPDRCDRFVRELLLLLGARTGGEQIPDTAAEVGAREDAIGDEREKHRSGGNVGESHAVSRN